MASLAQRVALVRQSEIHVQLATSQETPNGDASRAVHHYLAAMELIGCAMDGLFCIGPEGIPGDKTAQFAAPQAEVFFQVTLSKKLAAYRERVELLMEIVRESNASVNEDETTEGEEAEAVIAHGATHDAPVEIPSTVVLNSEKGDEMFDDLYKKFMDDAHDE